MRAHGEFQVGERASTRIAPNTEKQLKGRVKEQWGKLTDDDLDMIAGRREQLEGKIQERYWHG